MMSAILRQLVRHQNNIRLLYRHARRLRPMLIPTLVHGAERKGVSFIPSPTMAILRPRATRFFLDFVNF